MAVGGKGASRLRAPGVSFGDPALSLRQGDGGECECPLVLVRAERVLQATAWRRVRWVRGQRHFPGYYWAETTGSHVMYESRLELARLLIADHDQRVKHIVAQPFRVRALVDGAVRRHVPDFFLVHQDASVTVVNVKPAELLDTPRVAFSLGWAGEVFEAHGWRHEVWSGADPVYLANLRFLAAYRRPGLLPDDVVERVYAAAQPGDCIGGLRTSADLGPADLVKVAVLRLLWQQRLTTDLHRYLDTSSRLERAP